MKPEYFIAAGALFAILQGVGIALLWRIQRDQATDRELMRTWVHQEYLPRELADALFVRKPDSAAISATSKRFAANS